MKNTRRVKKLLLDIALDDNKRKQRQLVYLELLLFLISMLMSFINIVTNKEPLLKSTVLMAVASLGNAYLISRSDKCFSVGIIVFMVKAFALFTFFIITGGTEGFSTIWLLLMPACGMSGFGRKIGSIFSLTMLAELMLFFYTPLQSVLRCEYTAAFLLRFPVVYLCFFAVGYYLEYLREVIYDNMNTMRQEAYYQSQHDALTGLYNRLGFNQKLDACLLDAKPESPFALLIIDADRFKWINDCYGHEVGDYVLKALASRILGEIDARCVACRWGGEEFAVLISDMFDQDYMRIAESLREAAAVPVYVGDQAISITVSIGGVCSSELADVTARDMVLRADRRLYMAKEEGRNRCVFD